MTFLTEKQRHIEEKTLRAMRLYPKRFDARLGKGLLHIIAKKENSFFDSRSVPHLSKILLSQFFLQKQIENVIDSNEHGDKEVYAHVFSASSRICIALIFTAQRQSEFFDQQHFLKAIEAFVPGVKEIPD